MYVQVIRGKVTDEGRLKSAIDRWVAELSAGADGWLGSTTGVTDDGTGFALVRFESEAAARKNSDRPEQGEWWADASQAFAGDVAFLNSTFVHVDLTGDPGQAGFVQVMQGRNSDPDRSLELMARDPDAWQAFRPDVLGTLVAGHPDGSFTMAIYFTSEEAARAGERREPPPEIAAQMEEMNRLMIGEPTFYDLLDPWFTAPS